MSVELSAVIIFHARILQKEAAMILVYLLISVHHHGQSNQLFRLIWKLMSVELSATSITILMVIQQENILILSVTIVKPDTTRKKAVVKITLSR